ncbi:MAG: TadE/TadG family type IV pilus assembly protein [Pseudomonas sp.]|uniref:TadE/TadG family type IV pilus assembly protein n=1 Tax=Pseudomonas sp. TaxID=306 RepID=UPI00271F04A5|nr:TadE/TadG family type IV pilus assembly protein [Pseudomonas sp.]MDO9619587.1 TadE/TadG family type IV pilus assembly protein [Pseudomonas sp.]MDP2446122.1 TadE/TadG family type IV pilus assembly protein [Pseudomonas sp.]MDZ4336890.1 TadE/TadG family type IV pilus assembly protein [Pseudomonas sp.]
MSTPQPVPSSRLNRGQAMVEFLIIIPVLILLIFGAFQATLIYSAKSGLNYAAFQAARLGAVNNAQYESMRRGLLRGMYPMFSQFPETERMDKTAEEVDNFVLITRISPALNSFNAWQVPHAGLLSSGQTAQAIPNDNLMYRSAQQNPVSIQDANLLKIRVQYCVKLIVPMVENLLSTASKFNQRQSGGSFSENSKQSWDQYAAICGTRKGFVLTAEATVRMQSAAVHDAENCGAGKKMLCP